MTSRVILIFVLLLSARALADESFLREKVQLRLPTDGSELRTPPLESYALYHVRIFSPASLFPVYGKVKSGFFSTEIVSQILLDDRRFSAVRHDARAVEFVYHGLGRPLILRLAADYHSDIPFADVEVWPAPWWEQRLHRDPMPLVLLILVAGFAVTGIVGVGLWWCERQQEPWPPPSPPVGRGEAELRPTGREMFTPGVLRSERVYEVWVVGAYYYEAGDHLRLADACYATDAHGNFTERYAGLLLDGKPLATWPHQVQEADRVAHRYRFHIDGTGQRLSISLRAPGRGSAPRQHLALGVRVLPETTRSAAGAWRDAAVERATREREAQQRRWSARARELEVETEDRRNWEDERFRQHYLRAYGPQLRARKAQILKDHSELVRRETPEFLAFVKEHHPRLSARLTGEFEACLEAERREVERRRKPLKKLTTDEFRRRSLRRQQVFMLDRQSEVTLQLDGETSFIQGLQARGLSEQEIQEQLELFRAELEEFRARSVTGKEGNHAPEVRVLT